MLTKVLERVNRCGAVRKPTEPKPKKKTICRKNLPSIAKYIVDNNVNKIVTMGGEGMSEAAFKGIKATLSNLPKKNEALFDLERFRDDPEPFFSYARRVFPGILKPTLSHFFVRMLHEKGLLLRHYTKNLDNLERAAGIPADKLVEAHGTFQSSHCIDCKHEYDFTWLNERIMNEIPKCECGGVVRPDIVFFGEDLTDRFTELGGNDLFECDLLIVLGSSLEAQPFSSLVDKARSMVPRVMINRKIPPLGNPVLWGKGLSTGWNMNALDVTFQGECDVGCAKLAEAMDWATELRALYNAENGLNNGVKSLSTHTSRPIGKKLL